MAADVFVLHGFMGLPKDWGFGLEVNYMNIPELSPEVDLEEWGPNFIKYCQKFSRSPRRVLVGYSLGGRLAMHAFRAAPDYFSKVVLLSSHLGLVSAKDKMDRQVRDEAWAQKFESMEWRALCAEWNAQEVFQGSWEPERFESDFDRYKLALCLRKWSLGKQRDFRPFLAKASTPWMSITGEKDTAFTQLWSQFAGPTQHIVVKGAGHRLLFEKQLKLSSLLAT